MRNAFVEELTQLAQEDSEVIAMLADNGIIVFDDYKERFPKQFVNVGIAESNLISMASGMASSGLKPFVYTITPFLAMRPFEFIRNDVCYQNTNVRLIGIGAGFAYSTLGPTHHAIEDIALMNVLPNLTIFSPADPIETKKATRAMHELDAPSYLRIGTGRNPQVYKDENYEFEVGKGVVLNEGADITIVATGTILALLQEVVAELEAVSIELINIHTIKPFDSELVLKSAKKTTRVLSVEEHFVIGGLGSIVGDTLAENSVNCKFKKLGVKDKFVSSYGTLDYLRSLNGLDKESIKQDIVDMLK